MCVVRADLCSCKAMSYSGLNIILGALRIEHYPAHYHGIRISEAKVTGPYRPMGRTDCRGQFPGGRHGATVCQQRAEVVEVAGAAQSL